jgi:hypothetical protein
MEQEYFLSGYCRGVDGHRMVCVVTENGTVTECDCAYPACPHAPVCPVADQIRDRENP